MRGFAFLSFVAAALAAPAVVPGGSLVNAIAPVNGAVDAVVPVVAHVVAPIDTSVANVEADYNNIGNNNLNNNKVHVLRDVTVQKIGANKIPVDVNAKNPAVNVLSSAAHLEHRSVANVYAPVVAILKGLVALCAQVGVDAELAIANIGLKYNNILNNVGNNNDVSVLSKRAAVNVLAQLVAAIFACVRALVVANVPVSAIVGNISANSNQIANNVGNGNAVNVARGLVDAIAPVLVALNAVIPILVKVCADINADILNLALTYNNIANNVGNGNTLQIL